MRREPDICRDLRPLLKGEVLCDKIHRTLYSSAACMYQIEPLAVVCPRDKHDVAALLKYCYANSVAVTPRGAGSGLAGQAVGSGIVVDLTRHMDRILEIDRENRTVRVEPGVVLSGLNKVLQPDGLFFPPDPSSADYCTIGGMIANNSSGSRSLKYGATKDYVTSLEVVLSDGETVRLRKLGLDSAELKDLRSRDDHEGAIYTSMIGLLWRNREVISEHSWAVEKNSSGYNLKEAFSDGFVDLTKVMVGSEGTLGVVTEATLALLEIPPHRTGAVFFFDDLYKAGKAVLEAREFEPSAIEFVNESFLTSARGIDREMDALVPEGSEAMLLIEFDGEDKKEIETRARSLSNRVLRELGLSTGGEFASGEEEMQRLWRVRKAAVPIVMKGRSRKRPIAFVEDMVVPPEALPEFLKRLYSIFEKYSVDAPAYGHAGEGNIHVRPLLDLTCEDDVVRMEGIAREVYGLTKEVGGSLSGEHGDGLVRAAFLKEFSGPLYEMFFWTKKIFDPKGILNPGKKVAESTVMSENLRFGPDYQVVPTGTDLDQKKFIEEIEACHGCGMCRSAVNSTMCPVYRTLKDEKYAPRGKANLLRALIGGRITAQELLRDQDFRDIVNMCYGCRMCITECPTEVNIPLLVSIAKHEVVTRFGLSLGNRMFCDFERVGRIGAATAPLSNLVLKLAPARAVVQSVSGLARGRRMPTFNLGRFRPRRASQLLHGGSKVVYFPGCFVNFMDARLGQTLASLIEEADLELVIPEVFCCGIPSVSHGDLDGAEKRARRNIAALKTLAEEGAPIITTCPSCALALKEEYPELVGSEEAGVVASSVRDATAFVLELVDSGRLKLKLESGLTSAVYHEPCHLKALRPGGRAAIEIASRLNLPLVEIEDGCCGIGGTFGFKSKNLKISQQIGQSLTDSIKGSGVSTVITECPTCKVQIVQGTGLEVLHPVELLRRASTAA